MCDEHAVWMMTTPRTAVTLSNMSVRQTIKGMVGAIKARMAYPPWMQVLLVPLALVVLVYALIYAAFLPLVMLIRRLALAFSGTRFGRYFNRILHLSLYTTVKGPDPAAFQLLEREKRCRRFVLPLLAAEWLGLLCLTASGVLICFRGAADVTTSAARGGLAVFVLGGVAAVPFQIYRQWLIKKWQGMPYGCCPACGYIREFSISRRCPECYSALPKVPAGDLPPDWKRYSAVINDLAVAFPFVLVGTVGFPPMLLIRWIPMTVYGVFYTGLAVSIGALVVYHASVLASGKGDDV
jgi:hypothetical protein